MRELLLCPECQFESAKGEAHPGSGLEHSLGNYLMWVETRRVSHVPPLIVLMFSSLQNNQASSPSGILNTFFRKWKPSDRRQLPYTCNANKSV